jgi:HSP20 family protein
MALVRWNPNRELANFEREFNRMLNSLGRGFNFDRDVDQELENAVWSPLTDISETDDEYVMKMDLPGVKKDDVKISVQNGELIISGERKEEKEEKKTQHHRIERNYGKYYRSFTLPENVDEENIEAEFNDGSLTVKVPKTEEAKPKEIDVKVK